MALKRTPYRCGLEAAPDILDGEWKALILRGLREEPQRFGEFRRAVVGIGESMLIRSLRELEVDGVVRRHDFREIPARVEYSLTPFGAALFAAVVPLSDWGSGHIERLETLDARGRARLAATAATV